MRQPLSLEAFADWLATMPADQQYRYTVPNECAVAQFRRFIGLPEEAISTDSSGRPHVGPPMPPAVMDIVYENPHTFGAALKRARTALTSSD